MRPLIDAKKGDWYRADLDPQSLRGLQGYKVLIGIAMILGDELYNLSKVFGSTIFNLIRRCQNIGVIGSEYPAPNALVFRNMAILGVEGLSHCINPSFGRCLHQS
ncbi:hypothetical protein Syun_022365 [Stephania yunnanensis]|uniref:Uncharacterized protein n=1 Tax=Stephania yunnanensis TaxID=152371 RepID=A0AAP0F7L5_9MAGN